MSNWEVADKTKVIFILFSDLGIGGVQRKISDIATRLNSKVKDGKIKLVIILNKKKSYDHDEDVFLNNVLNDGAEVFYKPALQFRRFELPYSFYVFWKALTMKPRVMIAFMESYALAAIFAKFIHFWRKIRVVISYDNVASLLINKSYEKKREIKKWRFAIQHFFRYADRIILPSQEAKNDMVRNFQIPEEKTLVNKNWVTQFPKELATKMYHIVYTGRVDTAKNLKLFVDVVEVVSKKLRNISAVIIGWGDEIAEVSKYIHRKSLQRKIKILGSQIDVHKFLISSKVFLLTSDFEGLPISVLEAMACRLPVVVKAYPGVDEIVIDGRTGFIANTKEELAERLLELLLDERKREKYGKAARVYVRKYHGEKNLQSFINLFDL